MKHTDATLNLEVPLGIDFGTTNSCVSYINNNSYPVIVPNPEGLFTTPTCVYYDIETKEVIFGVTAQNLLQSHQNSIYLANIITNVKRLISVTYEEWCSDLPLQQFFQRKNTKIVNDGTGMLGIELTHNNQVVVLSVNQIITSFLSYIKLVTEEYLGRCVRDIVITVPAYFSDLQRCNVKKCCEMTGLNVLRVVNEPTAAALAYGFDIVRNSDSTSSFTENVLVIDCGGGTTDISILLMDYDEQVFEVKNVNGDNFLGGEDMTDIIVKYVIDRLGLTTSSITPKQFNKLKNGCESLKQQLSYQTYSTLHLENFQNDSDVRFQMSRETLISICGEFFSRVRKLIQNTIIGYHVDKVVLVGGTTRIPYISDMCRSIFSNETRICNTLDPDQTISIGAAVQGYLLNSDQSNTLGMTILDVVPTSLGVETIGGLMNIMVSKNTSIPTSRVQVFTNSEDHITELNIKVYQGGRRLVKDNKCLATFKLTDLNSDYKRGDMNIKVAFNIDANGILSITAEETHSSSIQNVTINVEKVSGLEHALQNLSLDKEDDFTFQDSYRSNQIIAKLELYDTFKYLLTFCHEHKCTFVLTDLQETLLNALFNKVFGIVRDYEKYSPDQLQDCRVSFEKDFHNIILLETNTDNTIGEYGSSVID